MTRRSRLIRAAALGAVSGLRTFQAVAWVAPGRSRTGIARALALAALGELAVDKVPGIPDRVAPRALVGRAVTGAVVGSMAAGPPHRGAGAVVGAAGAMAGAFTGWFLRREASRLTAAPDVLFAVAEDVVAVLAARALARSL